MRKFLARHFAVFICDQLLQLQLYSLPDRLNLPVIGFTAKELFERALVPKILSRERGDERVSILRGWRVEGGIGLSCYFRGVCYL
jgi:hypothetical protein